eukprot:CAMPEP_0118944176 /NCGR_PEP_ID=MMETSP1169-20130426/39780_1 /TAXON_ID=36882 /ORGANISM="Pyramimonas obovata, Strain CCMP722" /LENGTH=249 /DNA_ID=CAMNT_0006889609 /DNA_START=165 /DNA_END=914 /DNA_ORIENTATION=-
MGADVEYRPVTKLQTGSPVRLWPMALCTLVWLAVITIGILGNINDTEPIPRRVNHPLVPFDRLVRKAGPLIPFTAVLPRMLMPTTSRVASAGAATFAIYLLITVVRIVLYLGVDMVAPKSLADHILLGSSMYAILSSEIAVLLKQLADIRKVKVDDDEDTAAGDGSGGGEGNEQGAPAMCAMGPPTGALQLSRAFVLLLTCTLAAATLGDMYFTARYFHTAHETGVTAAAGLCIFQIPLAVWSFNTRAQ